MSIKRFFNDLFRAPADFAGQPYAYLTNQIGHVFLGGTVPMYIIALIYHLTGKYPDQAPIAINFMITYLIAWEVTVQGWRGLDTFLDTFFVSIGASFFVFVEMDIVLYRMLVIYTLIYAALFGTTYRIWLRSQ